MPPSPNILLVMPTNSATTLSGATATLPFTLQLLIGLRQRVPIYRTCLSKARCALHPEPPSRQGGIQASTELDGTA